MICRCDIGGLFGIRFRTLVLPVIHGLNIGRRNDVGAMTAKIAVFGELGETLIVNNSLTPHTPLSREIHETGDLFVADATRRSDINVAFQPQMLDVRLGGC